ncbi:MAG: hypothetical protein J6334_06290, partial [Kiritimatiellae bacterium]|nr:hypothetical protein [Kiritimatiellia bacterium]
MIDNVTEPISPFATPLSIRRALDPKWPTPETSLTGQRQMPSAESVKRFQAAMAEPPAALETPAMPTAPLPVPQPVAEGVPPPSDSEGIRHS